MGYKKREWWPGVILHVTARGNHRNDIFRDEEDFQIYTTFLEEAIEHFLGKFEIYSYCLMDNHVHLLIKTEDLHISNFISRVHSIYARFFNNKYNYVGPLFQNRYHTEIMEEDAQLLSTSRYIHLNPLKAKMVEKAEDYQWSSYSMFIGLIKENLISSEKILNYFKKENARELYKIFAESRIKNKNEEEEEYIGISS